MLLIGDVHINSLHKDRILDSIKKFINHNDDDKELIFLGDFVYHFSYDRKALLELLDLLLKEFGKGKSIYLLAGNHDWLSDSYVFQEAKVAFDILNTYSENKIYFVTSPLDTNIDGKRCLFLPYNIHYYSQGVIPNFEKLSQKEIYQNLINSNNKNERYSAYVNMYLEEQLDRSSYDIVFHHHYFVNTQFPGQKARFSYKDLALSDSFLKYNGVKFISGHLHTGFSVDNYFCTGSIWANSPLEDNDFKFMYKYVNGSLYPQISDVNYYLSISQEEIDYIQQGDKTKKLELSNLKDVFKKHWEDSQKSFVSKEFPIVFPDFQMPKINNTIIYFRTDSLGYEDVPNLVNDDLMNNLKEVKIKKYSHGVNHISQLLDLSAKDLQNNISDWKNLLKQYLQSKFPDKYDLYLEKLKDIDVI
ncbi:MAG: metallophosphoesterase [Candidatus Absconditabacteria bacterium]